LPSFACPARTWSTLENIDVREDALGPMSSLQSVAIDRAGNGVGLWSHSNADSKAVYARRFAVATGWGAFEKLDAPGPYVNAAAVALDNLGTVTALLATSDDTEKVTIWALRGAPGQPWSSPVALASDDAVSASSLALRIGALGTVYAVWQRGNGVVDHVFVNRYQPLGGWSGTSTLDVGNAGPGTAPGLAVDDFGNAIAVWQQSTNHDTSVWMSRSSFGGAFAAPTRLDDGDGSGVRPAVAMSGFGNAVVAWTQHRTGSFEGDLWAHRFLFGRDAETTHFPGETASGVSVAIDSSGNVGLASLSNGALSARSFVRGAWTAPTRITADGTQSAGVPRLAADRCGNMLAVWGQSPPPSSFESVWASRYTPAGGWSPGVVVDDVGHDFDPVVASNSAGQALLLFEFYGGGVSSIWANRLQ
jgi:hypothetical protein